MKNKKVKKKEPEIIAASGGEGRFFIKYRLGKQEWVESKPYSLELYKELIPYLGYA